MLINAVISSNPSELPSRISTRCNRQKPWHGLAHPAAARLTKHIRLIVLASTVDHSSVDSTGVNVQGAAVPRASFKLHTVKVHDPSRRAWNLDCFCPFIIDCAHDVVICRCCFLLCFYFTISMYNELLYVGWFEQVQTWHHIHMNLVSLHTHT